MDIKELEEKSSPPTKEVDSTKQVTSTVKKTKAKDPGRIAAGKKLAEYNKKAREAKKASQANKEIPNENKDERKQETSSEGSFSLAQIHSVASIVVSLAGLYYKKKELMSFVKPEKRSSSASERIEPSERRGAQTVEISEENLECLRECQREVGLKRQRDSKLKPMD